MTAQTVILDPEEVASPGRAEVPLTDTGLEIFWQGLDFGDQQVKQFMAEGVFGQTPVDHVWPTVTVKIPLVIRATEDRSFDDWRVLLQQKVAEINQDGGGRLKRVLNSGRHAYADLIEAKLHLSAAWLAERRDIDREATLELQRLPDWYGDVVTGTAHEFTGDGAFTMEPGGDMPARVEEMLVEDKSGNLQAGLMFHYRQRNYSSANTAEWAYNAEALGLLDIAEKVSNPGGVAYGSKVVKHPSLSTAWTPVTSTNKAGTTFLTHTGLYSVWARVYSSSEHLPWLRLLYGVGDVVGPQENVQVQVPGRSGWYWVPLGQVNVRALPFGAQRWEGFVQARGELGGENLYVDRIRLKCDDECSGILAAREATTPIAIGASDSLTGSGALKGSEATRGGKWEEGGSGTGFTRTSEGAERKVTEDSEGHRAWLLGSTVGPVHVQCEINRSVLPESLTQGVYLRYYDATHWVRVATRKVAIGTVGMSTIYQQRTYLEFQTGGSVESLILATEATTAFDAELDGGGNVTMRINGNAYRLTVPTSFKAGGTYAEGKVGIYDYNPTSTASVRTYKNFVGSPLAVSDAVMYANGAAFLSTQGMYRESEDGLGAAPIAVPGADLPRLPSGLVEIAVAPSRGQYGQVVDSGKDKFKVQMSYRPCFAEIPSS